MAKNLELYFYRNADGDQRVSNKPPVPDREFNDDSVRDDKTGYVMDICDDGLKVFGLKSIEKEGQIVKVRIAIEAVEVGQIEMKVEYKPLAARSPRKRK